MTAQIIDGKQVAADMRAELKAEVAELAKKGIVPGLAVVLVGEDPASKSYVTAKERACEEMGIYSDDNRLAADTSQEELMALVDFATVSGLTGLEFAAGIWGTVGGAVYGNAGAYGGEMKDVISGLRLISPVGEIKSVSPDYCRFGYRDSYLKTTREIIVDVTISLSQGDKADIERKVKEILSLRETKHPTRGKSAGCFFKNILDPNEEFGKLPAGRLLEEAGVKGLSVGGAEVFDKHANMIVNTGKATSKDIRRLADIMKKKVFDKFGIELEEEVIQVGEF